MEFFRKLLLGSFDWMPAINSDAVLYAFIAGLLTGWIWYAVAGSIWKASVVGDARLHSPRRYIFSAIAQIVMTIMLATVIQRHSELTMMGGLKTAASLWLGFVMPATLVNYANLGQRLSLTFVDGIHWLLVLLVSGAIIGLMGEGPGTAPAAAPAPAAESGASTSSTTTTSGATGN